MICSIVFLISLISYASCDIVRSGMVRLTVNVKVEQQDVKLHPVCQGILVQKNVNVVYHQEPFEGLVTAGRCCDVTKSIGFHRGVVEAHDRYIRPFPQDLPAEARWRQLFGNIDIWSVSNFTTKVRVESNTAEPRIFLSRPAAYEGNRQGVCLVDITGVDRSAFIFDNYSSNLMNFYKFPEFLKPNKPVPEEGAFLRAGQLVPDIHAWTTYTQRVQMISYSICADKFNLPHMDTPGPKEDFCVEYHNTTNGEPLLGTAIADATKKEALGIVTAVAANYDGEKHLLLVMPTRHLYQFFTRVANWITKSKFEGYSN